MTPTLKGCSVKGEERLWQVQSNPLQKRVRSGYQVLSTSTHLFQPGYTFSSTDTIGASSVRFTLEGHFYGKPHSHLAEFLQQGPPHLFIKPYTEGETLTFPFYRTWLFFSLPSCRRSQMNSYSSSTETNAECKIHCRSVVVTILCKKLIFHAKTRQS